jgi:NADH-quinone oxidoreductase subunit N
VIATPSIDWGALSPDLILLGAAGLLLLLAVVVRDRLARDAAGLIGVGAFVAAMVATGVIWDDHGGRTITLGGEVVVDRFANGVRLIVAVAGILSLFAAYGWSRMRERGPEFAALLLTAAAGMDFLAASNGFVTLFVSLELFSITLYTLCAFDVRSPVSLESGLKYLVLGSIGSAVLLYGAAFLYGSTGSLQFGGIAHALAGGKRTDILALAGTALVLCGLGFKIAVVPFHMWSPDVYEGAPTPVTGFMAAATKTAAFAALVRVLTEALPSQADYWRPALAVGAIVTMVVGNVAALAQSNLKRMLAYSSIAHAGYLLMAVIAQGDLARQALLFYLLVYTAMTVGSFAVIAAHERETGEPATIESIRGFGLARPVLGAALAIFLLSLGGFPPTAGFLAKVYVFSAAIDSGYTYLAVVGAITTVVSLGYYLRVGMALYDRRATPRAVTGVPGYASAGIAAVAGVALVLWLGVYPPDVLDWAHQAARSLSAGS